MLLEKKNAVIYGAGGAIGSAVAHAFARDGAKVFLAGRTLAPIREVASQIARDGGSAKAARVDALDEQAVEQHIGDVASKAGRIDILFNAIGMEDIQGTPLLDMSLDDFVHPVMTATTTQFITARAAARRMVAQRSGVIMSITAAPSPARNVGGFRAACSAIEGLWRSLASELGPRRHVPPGIRGRHGSQRVAAAATVARRNRECHDPVCLGSRQRDDRSDRQRHMRGLLDL